MLGELGYESRKFPRQVTCEADVPGDLLAHLKTEHAQAAFSAYCKQARDAYERSYDGFQELIGDVSWAAELVGPFRELVRLYRVVVDAYGILEYAVARGWLEAKSDNRQDRIVRETPASVLHEVELDFRVCV